MEKLFNRRYKTNTIRLSQHSYSHGCYFVTISTEYNTNYFGKILNHKINLSDIGIIAKKYWKEIPNNFNNTKLDQFIIMPNHIHGIIFIDDALAASRRGAINRASTNVNRTNIGGITKNHNPMITKNSLGRIIRWYKGRCTYEIHKLDKKHEDFGWHTLYYEKIIRHKDALINIRKYIENNPKKWHHDRNHI